MLQEAKQEQQIGQFFEASLFGGSGQVWSHWRQFQGGLRLHHKLVRGEPSYQHQIPTELAGEIQTRVEEEGGWDKKGRDDVVIVKQSERDQSQTVGCEESFCLLHLPPCGVLYSRRYCRATIVRAGGTKDNKFGLNSVAEFSGRGWS